MERAYFPLFIDLTRKKILVAGGGAIALRRVRTLLRFGADIHVIAPEWNSVKRWNALKKRKRSPQSTENTEAVT